VILIIAITAELNRPPFDVVEGESELVGDSHRILVDSIRLFYLAEFMNTITMSAIIVTLFFGGPAVGSPTCPTYDGYSRSCGSWPRPSPSRSVTSGPRGATAIPLRPADGYGLETADPLSLGWVLIVAGFLVRPAWGFLMIAIVLFAWILLTRASRSGILASVATTRCCAP